MEEIYRIKEETLLGSVRLFFKTLLEKDEISSVLVPVRSPHNNTVMPSLVSEPKIMEKADPLSPSFQLNAAKLVSTLTKKGGGERIAVFLRPCELRAFVELVKIKQASWEDLLVVSSDCAGAFSNSVFNSSFRDRGDEYTDEFMKIRLESELSDDMDANITTACSICDKPFPENADISIGFVGLAPGEIAIVSGSEKGGVVLADLGFESSDALPEIETRKKEIIKKRIETESGVFQDVFEQTSTIPGLSHYLSSCVNCYNCRVACPVCFCRECVFNTDAVEYEPFQYQGWAMARGMFKMPADTLFFHMTRMIHMGLSCVGCGQCSNACPNDIPLAELFKLVGTKARKGFDYVPGRSVDEVPPLSVFNEHEYLDVTGIKR